MQPSLLRVWIVTASFIIGCNLSAAPAAQSLPAAGGGPTTFFDDPQDNAVMPMGVVKILLHAQDPRGVARAEFSVIGEQLSTQESPYPKQKSVDFIFAWEPVAAGVYLLQARAQNSLGVWGQNTIISVQVEMKPESGGLAPEDIPTATKKSESQTTGKNETPAPTPKSWPVLAQGSKGEEVVVLQSLLCNKGHDIDIDGDFGPQTKDAVVAFQKSKGQQSDGTVNSDTWTALLVELKQGARGDAVYGLQHILGRKFHYTVDEDGDFGQQTLTVLASFQTSHPTADQDGTVGVKTWRALLTE
jgi:hypothetical protein